jgi:hypothetical protein
MTNDTPATAGYLVSLVWHDNGPWLQFWVATYEGEEEAKAAALAACELENRNVKATGARKLSEDALKRVGVPANTAKQVQVQSVEELWQLLQ